MRPPLEQHPSELADFTAWLGPIDAVVEIGVAMGGTIRHWHRLGATTIIGVDYHGTDSLGPAGTLEAHRALWQETRFKSIIGNSHDFGTFRDVVYYCSAQVDLLFIDGDHSYEGVTQDYQWYRPLVKPGGVIAFHDIVDSDFLRQVGHGTPRFWKELPGEKTAFLAPGGTWGGIGAIRV
jgi:predicted O-methyltransferase YrrM